MFSWLHILHLAALAGPASRAQAVDTSINRTIRRVERMVHDTDAQTLARRHGLSLVNVTWEDTGRSKHSAVGPNISDMTIGVRDSRGKLHPMPVYRFDNFHDKTTDIPARDVWVRTGNERGSPLKNTRLIDLLSDLKTYLSDPRGFKARKDDLTAFRDTHLLVSAQACFLPVSLTGQATFTPVIYNYQSHEGNPAVMTVVATREGTSVQVVENSSGYMSEVLYFNADGKRAPFTATRLSTFIASGGDETTSAADAAAGGADVVLVIQVPLKTRPRTRSAYPPPPSIAAEAAPAPTALSRSANSSDVETAVIGHGETEGRFVEINRLHIERDDRFPIRVTAQFYKATSNGVVTDADVRQLRRQIDTVYEDGEAIGSLVTDGSTQRPTEWVQTPSRPSVSPWATPAWRWHKAF